MGENTLQKQELETINLFLQSLSISPQEWGEHKGWMVIRVERTSILYTLGGRKITFQGEEKLRIPPMEPFLIFKRERECEQRQFNPEETEKERQHIRENMRKVRFIECDDWETSDTAGKTKKHLKRMRGRDG